MKKLLCIFMALAVVGVISLAFRKNAADKSESFEIESFVLIDGTPYIISEGNAYYLNKEEEWILYETEYSLKQLFRGEYFCALSSNGNILFETGMTPDEYASFPLGSAHTFYMAERLTELSLETPIQTLNHAPSYENCRALCEDGAMLINSDEDYYPFTIPDETIKDISGDFVLTENGSVYQIKASDSQTISYDKVSNGPVIMIAACETAPRCVGVYENGTAVMWSDLKPLDLSEWKDVEEVSAGFNYCVGLTAGGKILYADYDKSRESNVTDMLKRKTAEHITCSYETLALLQKNNSVEIIDLAEYQ